MAKKLFKRVILVEDERKNPTGRKSDMTQQEVQAQDTEAQEDGAVKIRPELEKYTKTKTATGNVSYHSGDFVATTLAGLSLDEVRGLAVKVTGQDELETKYGHLNPGQQRMNLGNRIRGAIAKRNKANDAEIAKALADGKAEPKVVSGEDKFAKLAEPFTKAAEKRMAQAAADKEKADAERAKVAAEKAAAKEKAAAAKAKAEAKNEE